jgi:hypothetical protein
MDSFIYFSIFNAYPLEHGLLMMHRRLAARLSGDGRPSTPYGPSPVAAIFLMAIR